MFPILKTLASVATGVEIAKDVLDKADTFVRIAEDNATSGPQKLAAVKAATEGYVAQAYPSLAVPFDVIWNEVAAIITGLVALYHAIGVFAPKAVAAVKATPAPAVLGAAPSTAVLA